MDKAEEIIDKDVNKIAGFFNYVFNFDDDNKANMLNMMQYVVLAVIPVVIILKVIKEYIPEEDDSKGSFELTLEVVVQLTALFMGMWFIDRIVRYIPTYSGDSYHKFNAINFIIPLLIILVTMQTKLGAKINILVDRVVDLADGQMGGNARNAGKGGNVRVRQPLGQAHQVSRADTMDSVVLPPSGQMIGGGGSTLINNLPNLNNGGQDPNARHGNDAMNLSMMDGGEEPMAANGLLGGAFGSGW